MRGASRLVGALAVLCWLAMSSAWIVSASASASTSASTSTLAAGVQAGCLPHGACATVTYTGDTRVIPYDIVNYYDYLDFRWHIAVTGGTITTATLLTHQDPNLPVVDLLPYLPTINGKAVDPAAVTRHGGDITLDLGAALPASSGAGIDVGYQAHLLPHGGPLSSWVSLSFDNAAHAGPATSVSAPVIRRVNLPDQEVRTGGTGLGVPRGMHASVGMQVLNHSRNASPLATRIVLEFSPGFSLGPNGVRSDVNSYTVPQCQAIGVRKWDCSQPHSSAFRATVDVAAAANTVPGRGGALTISVDPFGADAYPANNTRTVSLQVVGIARLSVRIQQPSADALVVGKPHTVSAVISNAGPDLADAPVFTLSVAWDPAPGFTVVGLDGFRWPQRWTQQSAGLPQLPAGHSITVSFQVTGTRVGAQAAISLSVRSKNFAPDSAPARATASTHLRVIAQPEAPASAAPPAQQTLPATGVGVGLAVILASALLALGAALSFVGRPRTRR